MCVHVSMHALLTCIVEAKGVGRSPAAKGEDGSAWGVVPAALCCAVLLRRLCAAAGAASAGRGEPGVVDGRDCIVTDDAREGCWCVGGGGGGGA